jgi:hypothetical protein
MLDGHTFKGYLPGGASGGILPASMDDMPLDFGQLEKYGCFVGSHAVVVLSDKDDMKDVALNLMKFFEDESCGQCTPCRNGTEKAVQLMSQQNWDGPLLEDLAQVMSDASICGLGQAAPNPLKRDQVLPGRFVTLKRVDFTSGPMAGLNADCADTPNSINRHDMPRALNDRQDQVRTRWPDSRGSAGETIWQVAKREGVTIPHLCWLPNRVPRGWQLPGVHG